MEIIRNVLMLVFEEYEFMCEEFTQMTDFDTLSEPVKKAECVLKNVFEERQGSQIYQEFGVPYILKWSLLQLFECNALRPDRIAYVYPLVTLLCIGMMTDSCLHQMCDWTRLETGLVE